MAKYLENSFEIKMAFEEDGEIRYHTQKICMKKPKPIPYQSAITKAITYKNDVAIYDYGSMARDIIPQVVVSPKPEKLLEMFDDDLMGVANVQYSVDQMRNFCINPITYSYRKTGEEHGKYLHNVWGESVDAPDGDAGCDNKK